MSLSRVASAVAVVAALSSAAPAYACSPPPPCFTAAWTMPPDGAVGVPLNAELEVMDGYVLLPTVDVSLRVAGTVDNLPLVAAATPGRWRTEALLAPNTEYELLGPDRIATGPVVECMAEVVVLATFTTGDSRDDTPPTDPTAMGGGCAVEICDSGSCCGPYDARVSSASWRATDDGALPLAYAFGSPSGPRTLLTSGFATDWAGIGPGPLVTRSHIPGPGPVFAIDAAGNVSASGAPFTLDFSCSVTRPDAGPRDAGPPDAGPPAPAPAGCAAAHRSSHAHVAVGGLLVTMVVLRRRCPSRR